MSFVNIFEHSTGVSYLKNVYQQIHGGNPRFSQRSFANKIGLDQSSLLRYFNGQRYLSVEKAEHIASRLALSEQEAHYFKILTVFGDRGHSGVIEKIRSSFLFSHYSQRTKLSKDIQVLSNKEALLDLRYAFALALKNLNSATDQARLFESVNFYLNLSESEISEIEQDLIKRGLVDKASGKKPEEIQKIFLEGNSVPRNSGVKFHGNALGAVSKALDDFKNSNMEIYTSVLTIKKEGREQIHQALRQLHSLLVEFHTEENADDVYLVSTSMLNLTDRDIKRDPK